MTELANRIAYGTALAQLGKQNSKVVVLDADLAKATQTDKFADLHSERFFDMGIAEQNMMGVAAGLATTGFIPFVSTFAVFASMRAVEQFRNMIAYPNLNVKIVVTHGGTENGGDGASHQSVEDIAIMRSIPNTTVIIPSDPISTMKAIKAVAEHHGPSYVRLGRLPTPYIYDDDFQFTIGKAVELTKGNDVTIIAVGNMVERALRAQKILLEENIEARVIDLLTVKPLDTKMVLAAAKETKGIITVEDHSIIGGIGSAVSEYLSEVHPTKVLRIGLQDTFGDCGDPGVLQEHFGLTVANIVEAAKRLMEG